MPIIVSNVSYMYNEWMMHLYNTLLCIVEHPKRFTIMWRGGGGLSSTTTNLQHPLGWHDGCHRTTASVRSPHTSYRWRGERIIEQIKWMGIIRRPWLIRASGGNLAKTRFTRSAMRFFNDHRESGPRFNVSFERWYNTIFICLYLYMIYFSITIFVFVQNIQLIACYWLIECILFRWIILFSTSELLMLSSLGTLYEN